MTIELAGYAAAVPQEVVDRLARARSALVIAHENPDADTLGASLAVRVLVESFGGAATLVSSDPPPALYHLLPGVGDFRTDPDPGARYDLLVVCDFGPLERMGPVVERHRDLIERLPRVVIDHHVSSEASGAADWIDPAAAATCEMAALLAVRLGIPLQAADGRLAAILTAGIVMDTATFAHPSTTARTLAVAAALVEAGAPLSEISRRLYRSKPEAQLRLFGAGGGRDGRRRRAAAAGRPDLPRHGGPCPPPHRNQAGGPRWDARPVRERGAAHLPWRGDAHARISPWRHEGISGNRLLRSGLRDRRSGRRIDSGRRPDAHASAGRRSPLRISRDDQSGAASLFGRQGRGAASVRAGPRRSGGPAAAA